MPDVRDAIEFMRAVNDAETTMRVNAVADLKFRYGDQWPQYATAARGMERPRLTINETDGYCRQVINNIRQQRPRMSPHPTGVGGSVEVAKVLKGLCRHIEVNSSADNAYDAAADYAVTMGWGYYRIRNDYVRENSFDQDIFIDAVENPFTVYFDNNSNAPDGSDAQKCLVTDKMRLDAFKQEYRGAQVSGLAERATGDQDPEWSDKENIRLAEYFYIDRKAERLVKLSDGTVLWASELPSAELLKLAGITIAGDRDSYKRVVRWCKQTAFEILEEKGIPGRWIPIVPVYGVRTIIEGKRDRMGMVRFLKDPAQMNNFWQTTITESLALAPKPKWLMVEGQDEGHEGEWKNANISTAPYLRYKSVDVDGKPAPPPQRIAPEPPPQGAMEATFLASQNLQKVAGIFDPEMRSREPKSGKALRQERVQSDNSNFHFYDNLTRSLMHGGRIIMGMVPAVFDTERVVRVIADDNRPKLVTINEKKRDGAVEKVLNDVTVGDYDIVMETGPGYDTKRQEGVEASIQLMSTPLGEKIAQVADDLIVRQMDFPGAEAIADRLAAANPLAQVDEDSEIPPKAQMMIKGLQQQLQQAGQQMQGMGLELKFKQGIEQMKQEGETKRVLLKETARAHIEETRDATKQHDVEARALTAQNVAEINGIVQLLVKHIDTAQLERELEQRNREQEAKANESATTLQ